MHFNILHNILTDIHKHLSMATYRLIAKKSQQTIAQTTHFFSTSPPFGENTRFSEVLRNFFIINYLHPQPNIQRSTFNISSCGWACFVARNMPIRKTIHGLSQLDTLAFATRKMPNGTSPAQLHSLETQNYAISPAGSLENPTQLFNQKT